MDLQKGPTPQNRKDKAVPKMCILKDLQLSESKVYMDTQVSVLYAKNIQVHPNKQAQSGV